MNRPQSPEEALRQRTTREVLEDHLDCRMTGRIEDDIARNYDSDVVLMTASGAGRGIDDLRRFHRMLQAHVPAGYEFPLKLAEGPYAYIEWRAREPGLSVEDGADSFVMRDGRIVFQSIHYSVQQTMPTAMQGGMGKDAGFE